MNQAVDPAAPPRELALWNKGFVVMALAAFLTFCNMAVFFAFAGYLRTLPIDPRWHGSIVGIFALVPLLLRPLISPYFTPGNAVRSLVWCSLLTAGCLLLYNLAQTTWSLLLVRALHGAAYVLLMSANLAGVVGCIEPRKSGQAFGYVAVIVLLPYAVIPPLMSWAGEALGDYMYQLNLTALLMLLVPPLMLFLRGGLEQSGAVPNTRPTWAQVRANLAEGRIFSLLALSLALYTSFAVLFYYVQGFGEHLGISNPGWFFTCSTVMEILVRVLAGRQFDRLPKYPLLGAALGLMLVSFFCLSLVRDLVGFLTMGLLFGVALGVAMPLINALAFILSPPELRSYNVNLVMQMFQGGFFLGPLLASPILAHGGYSHLFLVCASLCLTAILLLLRGIVFTGLPADPPEPKL